MFIVIVGVLFLAEYVFAWVYDIFALALMFTAGYEMSKAISNKYSKPLNPIIFLYIALGYTAFKLVHHFYGSLGITTFFAVLGVLIIVALVYNMYSKKHNLSNIISTVFCLVYPVSIMVYFLALNYLNVGATLPEGLAFTGWTYDAMATGVFTPNYRIIAIIAMLLCSSGTDIFALLVGMTLKGPKLAPAISPKKTISGGIGGLFGGMLAAGILLGLGYTGFMGLTPLSEHAGVNVALYMGLGFGIAIATQVGDLIASYIKRYCEIKDYGKIFPGHGGMLDRIDGMILSAVYTFAYFTIILIV